MQDFPLAQLIGHGHARTSEHVAETLQPLRERPQRQLEKEISGSLTGTRVDLPAMTLDEGHQLFIPGKPLGAEEKQMFQKMRKPRPCSGHIMTPRGHPQRSGAALEPWRMAQHDVQAVGEGQVSCDEHDGVCQ